MKQIHTCVCLCVLICCAAVSDAPSFYDAARYIRATKLRSLVTTLHFCTIPRHQYNLVDIHANAFCMYPEVPECRAL